MKQLFIYVYAAFAAAIIPLHTHGTELKSDAEISGAGNALPQGWSYASAPAMEIPDMDSDVWWKTFNDSVLNSFIAAGIDHNYNVAMALKRSNIARNAMKQARSGWYPTVALNAGWTKARESGMTTNAPAQAMTTDYFSAGLSASWEIDIFGKVAAGVKAKKAGYMASKAEYAGTLVSVSAQIASTYIQLVMYRELLEISRAHSEEQMKIVNIAKARFETTLASKLDVAQAQETYYSTTADIPMLENSIHTTINALAVLTGLEPEAIEAAVNQVKNLPDINHLIPSGIPADILRRRPDIAQAAMELEEYAAQVGVAKKDFLPSLRIDGAIGTSAHNISDMMTHESFTYSIAPTLSWTLFDGLARKYELASAKESLMAGIDNYNLTVLNAVQEVDNALSTYHNSLRHIDALANVIEQNDEALRLAVDSYKTSLSPMSDVVTAQLNSLSAESDMVSAKGSALSALITLYEALGGGFDISSLD